MLVCALSRRGWSNRAELATQSVQLIVWATAAVMWAEQLCTCSHSKQSMAAGRALPPQCTSSLTPAVTCTGLRHVSHLCLKTAGCMLFGISSRKLHKVLL